MKVLLLGATGLIGRYCLEGLLRAPAITQVIAPTRRALIDKHPRLQNLAVDFDRLDQYPELFDVDAILCCLGTTMKQAGSQENFRKVDYQYCLDAARLGAAHHVRAFLLVSAIGANERSPFFYSRVKGELEQAVHELGFDYLSIYHPSLLLGSRDSFRAGEFLVARIAPLINTFMRGPLKRYHSIDARTVATAMVNDVLHLDRHLSTAPKLRIREYPGILKMANPF